MKKKIIYVLIFLLIIGISGYVYFSNTFSEERPEPSKEDRISKSEREGVEENINAYDIENDLQLTQSLHRGENELMVISPQEKNKLLEEIGPKRENTILQKYDSHLPENITLALQYPYYNISYDYFLVTGEDGADIIESPDPEAAPVATVGNLDKLSLLHRVEGKARDGSSIWYRVAVAAEGRVQEGFIHSTDGVPRTFRFNQMVNAINELKQEVAEGELHYIINYKNQNGTPPQKGNESVDEYGYRFYHSAPAYEEPGSNEFRYVPDGMLVRILDEVEDYYHINIPTFNDNYYVPRKYIDPDLTLDQLDHVLVVDDTQQNQAAFELTNDNINLISYTLATTGQSGDFSFETSPGSYKAQEKKERFEYLKKGSQDIAGYAPFATRFSGGAYVHGVPVAYEEQNGEKIDPGYEEYLHTVGTFPRSSMCVRNFTSHAEFIYDWMDTDNGAVMVID
ncbi:MAG: L,D-transpeptidase family protein [Halanaerobiaceae bacterium]